MITKESLLEKLDQLRTGLDNIKERRDELERGILRQEGAIIAIEQLLKELEGEECQIISNN